MRQVSKCEPGIGGRQFLVNNGAGHRVQPGSSVRLGGTDAEKAEFPHATKQFAVETLVAVVFKRLRFNVFLRPFTHHFTKHQVFFARVGDVLGGHAHPSRRWLLTFGAPSRSTRERSRFFVARTAEHFAPKRPVLVFAVKFQRDDHSLPAVLAFVLLTDHEPHVRVNSNAVAVDAHPKGHGRAPLTPLR